MPKSLRKKNRHPVVIGLGVLGIALMIGLYLLAAPSFAQPPFPCTAEGSYVHVHPYLTIRIEGQSVPIPSQVGFFHAGSCLMPIHTHDASGILHIELSAADATKNFSLGDFFRIWHDTPSLTPPMVNGSVRPIEFTSTDILGYKTDANHNVTVKVDGVLVKDPVNIIPAYLDYCSSANSQVPPCYPTAAGDPYWMGGSDPNGTGHTIEIDYIKTG